MKTIRGCLTALTAFSYLPALFCIQLSDSGGGFLCSYAADDWGCGGLPRDVGTIFFYLGILLIALATAHLFLRRKGTALALGVALSGSPAVLWLPRVHASMPGASSQGPYASAALCFASASALLGVLILYLVYCWFKAEAACPEKQA